MWVPAASASLPCLLTQKSPLELAGDLVRMLAPAAAQIVPEVFVGLALPPLHDRAEQLPPERSLATFPCRGEERGRRCLQCHAGVLVSRLHATPLCEMRADLSSIAGSYELVDDGDDVQCEPSARHDDEPSMIGGQ